MNGASPLPAYNDASELENRARLIAQSGAVSVGKPGVMTPQKGFRIRHLRTKRNAKKRFNPKRPTFY